jgi:hypothetical protein
VYETYKTLLLSSIPSEVEPTLCTLCKLTCVVLVRQLHTAEGPAARTDVGLFAAAAAAAGITSTSF